MTPLNRRNQLPCRLPTYILWKGSQHSHDDFLRYFLYWVFYYFYLKLTFLVTAHCSGAVSSLETHFPAAIGQHWAISVYFSQSNAQFLKITFEDATDNFCYTLVLLAAPSFHLYHTILDWCDSPFNSGLANIVQTEVVKKIRHWPGVTRVYVPREKTKI